jgi:iron-sulfur cluster assembly accessory protein
MNTPLTVTERAVNRIRQILAAESDKSALRLAVNGGGCSGFQYHFDLVAGPAGDDFVVSRDGAAVVVDSVSQPFLEGAELDFVDDLMGQSFRVKNPNATASCGCGTSFSV